MHAHVHMHLHVHTCAVCNTTKHVPARGPAGIMHARLTHAATSSLKSGSSWSVMMQLPRVAALAFARLAPPVLNLACGVKAGTYVRRRSCVHSQRCVLGRHGMAHACVGGDQVRNHVHACAARGRKAQRRARWVGGWGVGGSAVTVWAGGRPATGERGPGAWHCQADAIALARSTAGTKLKALPGALHAPPRWSSPRPSSIAACWRMLHPPPPAPGPCRHLTASTSQRRCGLGGSPLRPVHHHCPFHPPPGLELAVVGCHPRRRRRWPRSREQAETPFSRQLSFCALWGRTTPAAERTSRRTCRRSASDVIGTPSAAWCRCAAWRRRRIVLASSAAV